ncbi:MAG: hypothetical protein K6C69_00915 [Lachnospiraceae bacterium]|nr:hypothetical protein [Lachnospiraceae bacterium]
MKERILDYTNHIQSLLQEDGEDTNWQEVEEDLLIQIGFFQHERLIHLIVTVLFAIMAFLTVIFIYISENPMTYALFLGIMVLLIPYIGHYYLLENKTQLLYSYYDKVHEKNLLHKGV